MTVGIQNGSAGPTLVYRLFEGVAAALADPVGDVAHFAFAEIIGHPAKFIPESSAALKIYSTAGTGPLSCKGRVWVRNTHSPVWAPVGLGTAANKGLMNNTLAITGAVTLAHVEPYNLPLLFDEMYLQVTDLVDGGGGDLRLTAEMILERRRRSF